MKKLCVLLSVFVLFSSSIAQLSKTSGVLDNMRAIHIGGNWGRNPTGIPQQPEDYYQFLRDISANWAAINIGLHVSSSMDATVEKIYSTSSPGQILTFRDEPLKDAIRGFKNHNINVMLTMAVETQEASQSNMPVNRWQLGDPNMPANDPNIQAANWPWATNHPQHAQFVASWWQSYTNEVVYFAKIAEQEGVKMFAVGAETERLFRTRAGGTFTNHFKDYIKALVDSVRKYFSGYITYELHWSALTDPNFYGPGSDYLWSDAGFDVVGVSAYFKLVNQDPNRVLGVDELEAAWNNIFTNYLVPLQNRNPGKKIVFHEFGYNDHTASPYNAIFDEFSTKIFKDNNANGKDDGEEQQANILDAFYRINENNARLVSGTFLWDNYICSNADWVSSFGAMRMCAVRNKLAQNIVGQRYASYTPLPAVPTLTSPTNLSANAKLQNVILQWQAASDATTYSVRVSDNPDFSTTIVNASNITTTSYTITATLNQNTFYYWSVKSKNAAGESNWSQFFNFRTGSPPNPPSLSLPTNNAKNVSTTVQFLWMPTPPNVTHEIQVSDNQSFNDPWLYKQAGLTTGSHQLSGLLNSKIYYWRVKSKNDIGVSDWSQVFNFETAAVVDVDEETIPTEYRLCQNYPNPFNPTTTIKFSIPAVETGRASSLHVLLKVYDLLGRVISTLVNEEKFAGNYEVRFDGAVLPSGIYFYRLSSGDFMDIKKMILLK